MANSIIDSKTDTHSFGSIIREHISTTLSLVEKSPGKFAITYQVNYSGIKSGNAAGGPVDVPGNGSITVNPEPKVVATIANYTDTGSIVSMHLTITVNMPGFGIQTIFDETLGGKYGDDHLALIVKHIAEISK